MTALGLPLYFVESPNHNLLQWKFSDGTHLNWDNNDALSYSDEEVRMGAMRTAGGFTREQEQKNRYLIPRTREEIVAYYTGLIVSDLESLDCIVDLYKTLEQAHWVDATTLNNYAWAFSTVSGFEGSDYTQEAIVLAEKATELMPSCNF